MNTAFDLISFGEIVWDVFEANRYIGGAPFNVSAHFALMGGKAALISAVGNDSLGNEALRVMGDYKISTRFMQRNAHPTATTQVEIRNNTPFYTLMDNGACDFIKDVQEPLAARCFYFGTYAQKSKRNIQTLQNILINNRFEMIFCDLNLRPNYTIDSIRACLTHATVLKINREEIETLRDLELIKTNTLQDTAKELTKKYPQLTTVVITLDKDGAIVYDTKENIFHKQSAMPCKIISTVGAGDSFSAGYIYQRLNRKSISDCLLYASERAALTLSYCGAVPTTKI